MLALWPGSFMQMRVPGLPRKDLKQVLLIADDTGYIHRELADRYEGIMCLADRDQAGELSRPCNPIWTWRSKGPT